MKNNFKIFAACSVMMLGLNSCDLTGLNENPNQPTDEYNMSEPLLVSSIRGGMIIDGNIEQRLKSLQIDFYSQMIEDGSSGWGTRNYVQNDSWNTGAWQVYLGQAATLSSVIRMLQNEKDPKFTNTIAFARVWRVYLHSQATDKFGPMPFPSYTEKEDNPPYKSLKDIYTEYFKELGEAIEAFNPAAGPIFSQDAMDLVYKNDVARWKKFANSLRLRLAVRLSEVDKTTCIAEAQKSINNGEFIESKTDNAYMPPKADGSWGQNYNYCMFQIDWGGPLNMSKSVEKLMTNIGGIAFPEGIVNKSSKIALAKHPAKVDPRGPIMFMPGRDSGDWAGKRFGGAPEKFNTGEFVAKNFAELGYIVKADGSSYKDRPYDFFLAEEVHFLKAELYARGFISGNAKAEYEAGVRASFESWGIAAQADEYLASKEKNEAGTSANYDDTEGAGNTVLEKIITQKYIAGIPDLAQEGWNDKRRLNLPRMDVGVYRDPAIYGGADDDIMKPQNFIKRMKYPVQESLINKAEYDKAVQMLGRDQVNSNLWWDKNSNYCTSAK